MIHTFMEKEFTISNYYVLTFNLQLNNSWFLFGHNPNNTNFDGLYLAYNKINVYKDGTLLDGFIFGNTINFTTPKQVKIIRNGNNFKIFIADNLIYETDQISWNTIGTYCNSSSTYSFSATNFTLSPLVVTTITPSVADYDGSIYGSDLHLELRDNHINLIDYGMLPNGAVGGAKIIVEDVPLSTDDLELQLEMKYNNSRFERLSNLTGEMQMRVYEDVITTDGAKEYANVYCSPMPVQNVRTVFTRHSEEGILYYVDNQGATPNYLTNAYNMYKGGVEIKTETGISLFDLDNAYSPVFVGNNLVRAEFHRRSGYVRLARYDYESGDWAVVNTLKIRNYPQLSLQEYNDDYCELNFGNTTWKFYRGRPFIICNHSEDDLRLLDVVDRVYCETFENDRTMGFVEEHDATCSVFNPQLSIQQFKQDLHIGQNIRLDNFQLYNVTSDKLLGEENTDSALGIVEVEDENALLINKMNNSRLALNFPSYANYVKKVGDTFSLLVDYVDSSVSEYTIKARGFDERGDVPVVDDVQYGIWEQIKRVSKGKSYTVHSDDLYTSYISGTSTKSATVTENGGAITITNTDSSTISTVTIDINHLNTYDYSFRYPTTVEFDLLDFSSPSGVPTNTRLQFYDGTNNSVCNLKSLGVGHIKAIVYDNKQEFYHDGVLIATNNMTVDNFRIALQTHTFIKIANLRVFTSDARDITNEQLYISKDANNVDTATISVSDDEYTITYNNNQSTVGTVSILETTTNYAYNSPIMIEFDIVSYTSPQDASVSTRFQCYDRTNNATCTFARLTDSNGHIKVIVEDGKQEYYCDNVLKYTTNLSLTDFRISWQTYGTLTIKNIRIAQADPNDKIQVTFTNCPSEVKYIDFIIIADTTESTDIVMKDFMYYEGDNLELKHENDTSLLYAEQVDIRFSETYYANLYNEDDICGLCVMRPNQNHIGLRYIYANDETVFAPYMKKSSEWDKPHQLFLEYLNSKRQVIDIDWEN